MKPQIDLRARRRVAVFALVIDPRHLDLLVGQLDPEQAPHVLVEHRDVEFEIEADERPRADEAQEFGQHLVHRSPGATSCSRRRCTLIASAFSLAVGLTVASKRSLVRMRLPRILIAATATMSSLRGLRPVVSQSIDTASPARRRLEQEGDSADRAADAGRGGA